MKTELKEYLTPPFYLNDNVIYDSKKSPVIAIKLYHSYETKKNKNYHPELIDFILSALNEKWKRDFGEPWWIKCNGGFIQCPKCSSYSNYMTATKYCPSCGEKLNPPEEI